MSEYLDSWKRVALGRRQPFKAAAAAAAGRITQAGTKFVATAVDAVSEQGGAVPVCAFHPAASYSCQGTAPFCLHSGPALVGPRSAGSRAA